VRVDELHKHPELAKFFMHDRPGEPVTNYGALIGAHRRNEIVFACIMKMAQACIDPDLTVETLVKLPKPKLREDSEFLSDREFDQTRNTQWVPDPKHPFRKLILKPNDYMSQSDFLKAWVINLNVFGIFFAHKERNKGTKGVKALHPLPPTQVQPHTANMYQVTSWKYTPVDINQNKNRTVEPIIIPDKDMIVDRYFNPADPFFGSLSPLAVAMGTYDADLAYTDFIRSFFNNSAVPSGLLKILNRTLTEPESQTIKRRWRGQYTRQNQGQHNVVVLDQNAEYQPLGSKLKDLDSDVMRSQIESRLCMVFGVPPVLIHSYVGMQRATYNNADQAHKDFWANRMSPLFKDIRTKLMHSLLTEYATEDEILGGKIRLNFDMSQVKALQEDVDNIETRARENFSAGIITLNEAREVMKEQPDPYGDYYLRNVKLTPSYPDIAAQDASLLGAVPAVQVISSNSGGSVSEDVNNAAAQGDALARTNQDGTAQGGQVIDTQNPQASIVQQNLKPVKKVLVPVNVQLKNGKITRAYIEHEEK
jgi:HK97 family phage portal protein